MNLRGAKRHISELRNDKLIRPAKKIKLIKTRRWPDNQKEFVIFF
jgi:hypothetical protein